MQDKILNHMLDVVMNKMDTPFLTDCKPQNYPPYNITRLEDKSKYTITMAVAGFDKDEIEIKTVAGMLYVEGRKHQVDGEEKTHLG